jgi:uncharacterized protein (DUF952 family)/ribosomal protein S18 acetylase RimI-like enzyme
MSEPVLHITSYETWQAAVESGRYEPESLSTEGFIHCSLPSQILGVANAFYRGQHGLILLVIDPDRLVGDLKWEPPSEPFPSHARAGDSFPHLYGALNLEAVVKTVDFEPGANGQFNLLPDLSTQPPLTIRLAKRTDADLASRLIYLSMGELADYLFGEAHLSVEAILAGLFLRDANRFSWRNTEIAEWEGVPAGMLASFAGRQLIRYELAIGLGLLRLCGLWEVLRLSPRALSIAGGIETRRDEYYLANLGVLPDYQNRGIGSRLLNHAEGRARLAGLGKCSLIVDLENPAALRLYERHGYRIVYSKEYPGPAEGAHAGYHRMVKVLD